MDQTYTTTDAVHYGTTIPQTEPLHQYAPVQQNDQQVTVYPPNGQQALPVQQYGQFSVPAEQPLISSEVVAAGVMGVIVAGTGTMGGNLHKIQDGDMTMGEAVTDSLTRGAAGGVAAAAATLATKNLTSGGFAGLAVTLATATGVSYLLGKK